MWREGFVDGSGIQGRAHHHGQIGQVVGQTPQQFLAVVDGKVECCACMPAHEIHQQPREVVVAGADHAHTQLAAPDALEMRHGRFGFLKLLDIPRLLGPETVGVTMQNGIPYWYFHKHGGALQGSVVSSVDASGSILKNIPAERVVGCVVYPASELVRPGVVRHIEGDRFPVGELDGSASDRVQRVSRCLTQAGFKAPVLDDIRAEIWLKLWGGSPAQKKWANTRRPCCRTSRRAGRRRLTRWWVRWSNWDA